MLKKISNWFKAGDAPKADDVQESVKQAAQQSKSKTPKSDNKPSAKNAVASFEVNASSVAKEKPWSLSQFIVAEQEGKIRFHDFDLHLDLMRGIAECGFEYCSPIQAASLPETLPGKNLVGKAQTGTGKTAAFLIQIINHILNDKSGEQRYLQEPKALIIAPTRELVMQIAEDAKELGKYTYLDTHTLVGGMDYQKQQKRLEEDIVDILVATPGRLLDFCRGNKVDLRYIEILVIDEADRMLDMGFIPQVKQIIRQTPEKSRRQTLLFSATFTQDVINLTGQWTVDPVTIEIEPESVATDTVEQFVYMATAEDKYTLLRNILNEEKVGSVIIFANRRDQCRRLKERLDRDGYKTGLLSGEVAQNKRVTTLNAFKTGKITVLVATDVAGRGIHIDGVSHVINYTLPEEPEDYVHRIGRTGRAGETGISVSFACEDDAFNLPAIEEFLGEKLICEYPPEHLLRD